MTVYAGLPTNDDLELLTLNRRGEGGHLAPPLVFLLFINRNLKDFWVILLPKVWSRAINKCKKILNSP